jgi:hypothetical protein
VKSPYEQETNSVNAAGFAVSAVRQFCGACNSEARAVDFQASSTQGDQCVSRRPQCAAADCPYLSDADAQLRAGYCGARGDLQTWAANVSGCLR